MLRSPRSARMAATYALTALACQGQPELVTVSGMWLKPDNRPPLGWERRPFRRAKGRCRAHLPQAEDAANDLSQNGSG